MAFTTSKLSEALGIDETVAARVIRLIHREESPFTVPDVEAWRQQCHHEPREYHAETIMRAIDAVIGTSGTEAIWGESVTKPVAEYCNAGDTYSTTILYDYMAGKYRLTTWGDWVEKFGDRYGVQ